MESRHRALRTTLRVFFIRMAQFVGSAKQLLTRKTSELLSQFAVGHFSVPFTWIGTSEPWSGAPSPGIFRTPADCPQRARRFYNVYPLRLKAIRADTGRAHTEQLHESRCNILYLLNLRITSRTSEKIRMASLALERRCSLLGLQATQGQFYGQNERSR